MDDLSYDDMRVTLATWTGRQTMTPARRRDIAGLFEAVIARAEAAVARVAELEAALAAERAAHQWRPVTADWPPRNQRVVISAPGASWADVARKQHDGEEYVWQLKNGHVLDFESATVAIPLPPAPAPQEPTP